MIMSRQQQRLTYYDMVQQVESLTLDLTIVSGRDLVPKDRNAYGKYTSSDPYVRVFLAGELVHKTKVVPRTLNPTWAKEEASYQTKLVGQNARDLLNHPKPLHFVIYDKDQIGDDDCMGDVCHPINIHPTSDGAQATNEEGVGTWFKVQKGDSSTPHYCKNASGELLVQVSYEIQRKTSVFDDIALQSASDHGQKRGKRSSSSGKLRKSSSGCDVRSPRAGPARRCRSIDDPWNWSSPTPRTPKAMSKGHETRPDTLKNNSNHNKTPNKSKSSRYLMSMDDPKTPTVTPPRTRSSRYLMSTEDSKTPRRSRSSRYLTSMDPLRNSSHHSKGEGNQQEKPSAKPRKSSLMLNSSGHSTGERTKRESSSSHRRRHPLRSKDPLRNSSHDGGREKRQETSSSHRHRSLSPSKRRSLHKRTSGLEESKERSSSTSRRRSSSLDPMKKRRQRKKLEETSSSLHERRRSSSPSSRRRTSGKEESLEKTLRRSSSKDPSRRRRTSNNKALTSPASSRLLTALVS